MTDSKNQTLTPTHIGLLRISFCGLCFDMAGCMQRLKIETCSHLDSKLKTEPCEYLMELAKIFTYIDNDGKYDTDNKKKIMDELEKLSNKQNDLIEKYKNYDYKEFSAILCKLRTVNLELTKIFEKLPEIHEIDFSFLK